MEKKINTFALGLQSLPSSHACRYDAATGTPRDLASSALVELVVQFQFSSPKMLTFYRHWRIRPSFLARHCTDTIRTDAFRETKNDYWTCAPISHGEVGGLTQGESSSFSSATSTPNKHPRKAPHHMAPMASLTPFPSTRPQSPKLQLYWPLLF